MNALYQWWVLSAWLVVGIALILVGVISHSSRRAGRREQEVIDRVRRA